jgi:predicted dinucleotide-binding enzyme
MDIGIIGAGNIGGTLGRLLVGAGHRVRFGLRNPAAADDLVKELFGASADSPGSAVAFGECVIFAGPFLAWPGIAQDHGPALAGKVVIDAANPIPGRDGAVAAAVIAAGRPSGVHVAGLLPGSSVAKAFNTVYWVDLRDKAHRAAPQLGMPFAADDPEAARITEQLARDAGFDPIFLGTLSEAAALEPGSAIYAKSMSAAEIAATLGLDKVRESA